MSNSRQRPALTLPPRDVSRFPRPRLLHSTPLSRAHTVGKSPWWFNSTSSGRFDLIQPNGTCYLAADVVTALRERFGHDLVDQGIVTFQAAARTLVSTVRVPSTRWFADTCSPRAANFGMNREVATCPTYEIPQAWAVVFFTGGRHSGIRYQTRFITGAAANAVALFGPAGQCDWPTESHPIPGAQACTEAGITVAHRPTRRQIRIVQPAE